MMNGPRGGQRQPSTESGSGGGMSPLVMALLGLLAYKAFKGSGGQGRPAPMPPRNQGGNMQAGGGGLGDLLGGLLGGGRPGGMPGNMPAGGRPGGGLADMIPGGLGGLLGGAAAGTVLSGGLENLIKGFQQSGQGRAAQSWVDRGQNEQIEPGDWKGARGRHDRRAQPADRNGARGVAHRTEPAAAGLRRPAHARRAVADRGRGVAAGVRLPLSRPGPGSVHADAPTAPSASHWTQDVPAKSADRTCQRSAIDATSSTASCIM